MGKFHYKIFNGDIDFPKWEVNFGNKSLRIIVVCLYMLFF
jgi:hypothetical protein